MKSNALHFALTIFVALFTLPSAFAEPEQYVIKQSEANLGTNFKQPIVLAGTIPLDERYAELTTEQKNKLKAPYEKMGDNDEPPFPLNGLRPLYAALGKVHEKLNLFYKGPVTMYVQIDSKGNPGAMNLVEAPDPEMGQALANIMALQKFKPALCKGIPCSMPYMFHAELLGPDMHNMKSPSEPGMQLTQHWPPG